MRQERRLGIKKRISSYVEAVMYERRALIDPSTWIWRVIQTGQQVS